MCLLKEILLSRMSISRVTIQDCHAFSQQEIKHLHLQETSYKYVPWKKQWIWFPVLDDLNISDTVFEDPALINPISLIPFVSFLSWGTFNQQIKSKTCTTIICIYLSAHASFSLKLNIYTRVFIDVYFPLVTNMHWGLHVPSIIMCAVPCKPAAL